MEGDKIKMKQTLVTIIAMDGRTFQDVLFEDEDYQQILNKSCIELKKIIRNEDGKILWERENDL